MELSTIILLCLIAFLAGYVDAVVGGGGLIQVPAGTDSDANASSIYHHWHTQSTLFYWDMVLQPINIYKELRFLY